MTRGKDKDKLTRAKISIYKPRGKKHTAGSTSMVVLTPTTTRRGKTIYKEMDATPYYTPSNEEGESSKRKPFKTPSRSRTTSSTPLKDASQWNALYLDDEGPYASRITKVRIKLSCVL
jgi:hypothetical protein